MVEENKDKKDLINESGKKASDIHERGEKKLIAMEEEDKEKKDSINESEEKLLVLMKEKKKN